MNLIKKSKSLIIILVTLLVLIVGCTKPIVETTQEISSEISEITSSEESPKNEETSNTSFPVSITDQVGRTIVFEKKVESIVSAYYIPSYSLMSLGLQENVVGIENKPESRPFYEKFGGDMDLQPQIGTRKELNLEEIISLEPDLVILPEGQEDGAQKLEDVGIKSIIVAPENEELYREMLEIIGKLTNKEDRVTELNTFYEEKSQILNEKLSVKFSNNSEENMKTAYIASNSSPLRTASKDMFQSVLLENAKITSVTAEIEGSYWADISLEQIIQYNPEYIFIASRPEFEVNDILNNTAWSDIDAVKDKNIFIIPSNIDNWDTPSFASVIASYWMVSKSYPEVVTREEVLEVAKEYYQLFFNYTVTEEDLGL